MNTKKYIADNINANYLSIGCLKNNVCTKNKNGCKTEQCKCCGMFKFDQDTLYNYITDNYETSQYCFVERRTEYFMLFFDLDVAENIIEENKLAELFDFIIDNITKVLSYYIRMKNSKKELRYIYSDRNDKRNKLHIYFPNIILNKHHCMAIREKLIEYILKDNKFGVLGEISYRTIIDESVYKQSGLRLLFQKKPHEKGYYGINFEKSTYKKLSANKYDQLVVTSVRCNNDCINVKLNMDDNECELLANDTEIIMNNVNMSGDKKIKRQKINDNINIGKHEKLKLTVPIGMVEELFKNLSKDRYSQFDSWIRIVLLCKNYGLYDLAHIISKYCMEKYNKVELDGILYSNGHCKNPITIGSLFEWSKKDNLEEHKKIISKYMVDGYYRELKCNRVDNLAGMKICESYSEKFAKSLEYDKYNVIILKSPLGSNKSGENIKAIVELVEKYGYKKICCLASRVVLVGDLYERFNEPIYGEKDNRPKKLKMEKYSDIYDKSELYKHDRLIQTPDSLIYMINNGKIEIPDILFADEIESIFEYICMSDTLKNTRKLVFSIFIEYIKKAKHVLLADGNVSKHIVKYIKKIRSGNDTKMKLIYNKYSNDDNKYFFMKNEHEWNRQMDGHLMQGKKIFISTDSKDFSDRLYKYITTRYPKLMMRVYNADTDDEIKLNIGNVNDTWNKLDVIIISPSVLYGVNMSTVHFDYIYGYYQNTIMARSVYQQLRRVRYVKSKEVYLYLKDSYKKDTKYYVTEIKELARYVISNRKEFANMISNLESIYDDGFMLDLNNHFNYLYLFFLSERHKCNNNYIEELVYYITEYGGRVYQQIKNNSTSLEYKKCQDDLKDEITGERIRAIMLAYKDIDKYEQVRYKPAKTYHDRNIIFADYILETFGLEKINENFLKKIERGQNIDRFGRSVIYFANKKYIDNYVKYRASIDFPISLENEFKKINLIREFVKLFWKNGLLDQSKIKAYSNQIDPNDKDKLDALREKKIFIDTNKKLLKGLFMSLKQKVDPKNESQIIDWLDCILREYFGGFVYIDKAIRQRAQIGNQKIVFYPCVIKCCDYIELLINKDIHVFDKSTISIVKNIYGNVQCTFTNLHGKKKFNDMFINSKDEYLFDK